MAQAANRAAKSGPGGGSGPESVVALASSQASAAGATAR